MCKVYKINFPNGKCYVGVTNTTFNLRFAAHKHAKYAVGAAIRKYNITVDSMEMLYEGSEEDCYELENLIVDSDWVKSTSNYNLCLGGERPPGVSMKGSDNPMWKGGSYCKVCGIKSRGVMCKKCRDAERNKNQTLCKCGCGEYTTKPKYEYIRGHKPHLGRICKCGCGQRTDSRNKYRISGH